MEVLDGLNPEQRRAAEAVRGPVCILAGAGTGKTTTITRRIAHQVATGAFRPDEILAVTFTDKAGGVLRARLAALGVQGVAARTFHSAALRAAPPLRPRRGRQDPPDEGAAAPSDRATGCRRRSSSGRRATSRPRSSGRRTARRARPVSRCARRPRAADPAELMARVYRDYERAQGRAGRDRLRGPARKRASGCSRSDAQSRATFRARYRAFTVDEYQDVNLLQQSLLDQWLGERDDLCVVGDDYQSIYAFTGASPALAARASRERFPQATVVRLERNYRSSPRGARAREPPRAAARRSREGAAADAAVGAGPGEPLVRERGGRGCLDHGRGRTAAPAGTAYEEIAVLARTNARLADFEEASTTRDPVPGLLAARPRRRAAAVAADRPRRLERRRRRVRALAEQAGMLQAPPRQARRAGADPAVRPGAARPARGRA